MRWALRHFRAFLPAALTSALMMLVLELAVGTSSQRIRLYSASFTALAGVFWLLGVRWFIRSQIRQLGPSAARWMCPVLFYTGVLVSLGGLFYGFSARWGKVLMSLWFVVGIGIAVGALTARSSREGRDVERA